VKNGYWYNNKCWKDYEDNIIHISKIDSSVSSQKKIIEKSIIEIDNQTYPLVSFLPLEKEDGYLLIAVYGTKNNYKTPLFPTGKKNIKNEMFETPVMHFNGDAISGTLDKQSQIKGTCNCKYY
jgi:hypothetical protein